MTQTTEVLLVSGDRCQVEGSQKDVEQVILTAARGSIMQFAWLVEAETGEQLALNPDCVVTLREVGAV